MAAEKKHPLGFVFSDGTVTGPLRVGMTIEGIVHKSFVLRDAAVDDLLDAELDADVTKPLNFSAQLMLRQLVMVGDYKGPFTLNMIRRLKPVDWRIMRAAQSELDDMGEGAPASGPAS